jgi:hypothetical protein
MPDLVPVEHDPFNFTNVDHDPFQQPNINNQPIKPVIVPDTTLGQRPTQQFVTDVAKGMVEPITNAGYYVGGLMQGTEQLHPIDVMKHAGEIAAMAVGPKIDRVGIAAEKALAKGAAEATETGIKAYHGSPHDFDQFDLSKIGTGEGAQAYGHGMYFAENEGVAKAYRNNLSAGMLQTKDGLIHHGEAWMQMRDVANAAGLHPDQSGAIAENIKSEIEKYGIKRTLQRYDNNIEQAALDFAGGNVKFAKGYELAFKKAQELGIEKQHKGKMYEVNIKAHPDEFLDWDKPLSEQSKHVQEKLADKFGIEHDPNKSAFNQVLSKIATDKSRTAYSYNADASQAMREAGIKGIKYLDQGSRPKTDWIVKHPQGGENIFPNEAQAQAYVKKYPDEGYTLIPPKNTKNFVVFDDKLIDIVKKYGLAGLIAGGAAHGALTPVDHDPFTTQ